MRHSTCLAAALVFWTLQSSAAPVEYPSGGGGDKDVKTPKVDVGNQVWTEPLLGFGVKTNDAYTDGNLFLVVPLWSTLGRDNFLGGDYIFMEPYTSVGEGGEVTTSLGLSWRHLFSHESVSALQKQGQATFMEEGWFIGANVFLDMLDTQHNNNFWQMGVGAEVGSRYLELRGNYYIPMTGEKLYDRQVHTQSFTSSSSSTAYNSVTNYGDPYATGNSIMQPAATQNFATTTTATTTTTVRTVTELFEKGMEGWDAEASFLVPWLDQWMDLRLIGGYFSFNNQPFGPQDGPTGPVHGWKAGAELRPVPAVVLGSMWYEDKRFAGGNWIVSAQLQIPMDKTWKNAFQMRRRHLVEHLAEPVHRQNDAIKVGNREDDQTSVSSSTSVKHVTRVVSQSSTRLVLKDDIIFVNNGGTVGNGIQAGSSTGDGTAQHPVNAIQTGADIAATNNNITGRVWNVYTQQSSAGAYVENIAVKRSTNFISSGVLIPVMGGKTFGTGVKPTLQGGFGTGDTPLSFVGLSGYNVVANFDGYPAVTFRNVQTGVIASNYITNPAGVGIEVTAGDGNVSTVHIINNIIDQTTLCGCFNAVQVGAFEMDSKLTVNFNNNVVSNTNGSGVNAAAAAGGLLIFNANGNAITNAGRDGMTFTSLHGKSLVVANLSNNSITGSGAYAEPETPEGSGVNVSATDEGRVRIILASNDLSHNSSSGLSVLLDGGSNGIVSSAGNNFSSNGIAGAFLVTTAHSTLKTSFLADHFDSNDVGIFANADGGSDFFLNAASSTFIGNNGPGVHIESHRDSFVLPSVISGSTFAQNGGPALELATTDNAYINLALKNSTISTSADVGILAKIGDGDPSSGPGVNLVLSIANTSIYANGVGATGIDFVGSGTGNGALTLDNVDLTMDSANPTGIRLASSGDSSLASNVSAIITNSRINLVNTSIGTGILIAATGDSGGAFPSVAANIVDTSITVTGASTVLEANANLSGSLSLYMEHDTLTSSAASGGSLYVHTEDDGLAMVNINAGLGGSARGNTFNYTGVAMEAHDTSTILGNVTDNTFNSYGLIFFSEDSGSTVNAVAMRNVINTANPFSGGVGIEFQKAGLGTMAEFNNNVITNGDYGIRLTNNSSTAFTANINGNQANSAVAGIVIHSGGGDFSANINGNTISGAGINGIVFEIQSPATVHVNPLVTPESNIIGVFRPSKLGIINTSTGTVDGTIIINSITLTPPTNF